MSVVNDKITGGPTQGVLNGLATAERNQSYFLVFEEAGDTSPEIIDNTAYFITYLVDENGNVAKPTLNTDSFYNLIQNFPIQESVVVRIDNGTILNEQLGGELTVTGIGKQQPLLYTQTGYSQSQYDLGITFQETTLPGIYPSTPSILGDLKRTGPFYLTGSGVNQIGNFTIDINPDPSVATLNATNGTYSIITTGLINISEVSFRITFSAINQGQANKFIDYYLKDNNSNDSYYLGNVEYKIRESGPTTTNFYLNLNSSQLAGNPEFALYATFDNDIKYNSMLFGIKSQTPSSVSGSTNTLPLLETSSNTWITGSQFLSNNYGKIQAELPLASAFGFSPVTEPFTLQKGDRIRFEYNKNKDYTIYEVTSPDEDSDNKLKFRLNTTIPEGTELNNFVFHRIQQQDPAYIILDVKKLPQNDTQNFRGFILPKYPSQTLKDNFNKIISQLKEKGIIKE
jgi:hypothetical protein